MVRTRGFLVLFLIDFCFKQNTMGFKQNMMGFKQNTMGFKQKYDGFLADFLYLFGRFSHMASTVGTLLYKIGHF